MTIRLYLPGDPCPECKKPLVYDEGEEQSQDHPGSPEEVFCKDCGIGYPLDSENMPNEESEWYEELNRGYNMDRI